MVQSVAYNGFDYDWEDAVLAEEDGSAKVGEELETDIRRVQKQVDMLDHRLDSIDSMVTAVAERVMSQLITLNITCPHCGEEVEITVVGNQKPRR